MSGIESQRITRLADEVVIATAFDESAIEFADRGVEALGFGGELGRVVNAVWPE